MTVLCSLGLLLVSCGDNSTGINGGDGEGNTIGTEPTFDNVLQIFEANCGSCHIGNRTNGVRLDSYQNVIESEGATYGELVVQPGDATGSPLIDKIEANPKNGDRMPRGGPYLSNDRINQIKQWIDNGAQDN